MDHHTNWRYREELATQLIGVLDLCTPEHARANVAPIALALLDDRVAAVREAALPLVSFINIFPVDNLKIQHSVIHSVLMSNFAP